MPGLGTLPVFTPDDVMDGRLPAGGRVVVFDDDHYYMAGVIAELLVRNGCEVTFVTPEALASSYTQNTSEQSLIQRRLLEQCAALHPLTGVSRLEAGSVHLSCVYTGRVTEVQADAVVLVTGSVPREEVFQDLDARGPGALAAAGVRKVVRIGDCLGPGVIAAAVHSGHLFARTLDTALTDLAPFRRETVGLDWDQPLPATAPATAGAVDV